MGLSERALNTTNCALYTYICSCSVKEQGHNRECMVPEHEKRQPYFHVYQILAWLIEFCGWLTHSAEKICDCSCFNTRATDNKPHLYDI